MRGKHITHCSTHHHAVIYSGASCISFHFTCCVVMFHRKCCAVIQQVLEQSHWSNSARACAHTRSKRCDSLVSDRCWTLSSSSPCTHTHTHTDTPTHSSRCAAVVVLLMYSTASAHRSSWLITSCFLFLTRLLPAYWAAWSTGTRAICHSLPTEMWSDLSLFICVSAHPLCCLNEV